MRIGESATDQLRWLNHFREIKARSFLDCIKNLFADASRAFWLINPSSCHFYRLGRLSNRHRCRRRIWFIFVHSRRHCLHSPLFSFGSPCKKRKSFNVFSFRWPLPLPRIINEFFWRALTLTGFASILTCHTCSDGLIFQTFQNRHSPRAEN